MYIHMFYCTQLETPMVACLQSQPQKLCVSQSRANQIWLYPVQFKLIGPSTTGSINPIATTPEHQIFLAW